MNPPHPANRSSARYTIVAVVLHWFLAVVIVMGFLIGLQMSDEPPSPLRVRWINYHKWIGITILGLSVLRLLWRISHPPPTLPESMRAWQRTASNWVHRALYLFLFHRAGGRVGLQLGARFSCGLPRADPASGSWHPRTRRSPMC